MLSVVCVVGSISGSRGFYAKKRLESHINGSDTQDPLFLASQWRVHLLAHLMICVCFLMMMWQQWSVTTCGNLQKKAKFFRWMAGIYSYIKIYAFLVILMSHLSPILVVFRLPGWEKTVANFQSGDSLAHMSHLYSEKHPKPSDCGHRGPWTWSNACYRQTWAASGRRLPGVSYVSSYKHTGAIVAR